MPEKYKFWRSNQTGVCPRPIAITSGPQGTLLVLDYDFESSTAKLVVVRLHQPADVSVKKGGCKDARDISKAMVLHLLQKEAVKLHPLLTSQDA